MNYFQTLPKDLNYIIFTYSDIISLYDLSKELELYIDYEELLRVKYPKNYSNLKRYVKLTDIESTYRYLELYRFNDDLDEYSKRMLKVVPHGKSGEDVYELISRIYLDVKYPELRHVFNQFPHDEHKYTILHEAMSELEKHDDELTQLIFHQGKKSDINLERLSNLIYNEHEHENIYYLILAIKYNLTPDDFGDISFADTSRENFSRDDFLDISYINYETKVIQKLNEFIKN